MQAFLASDVIYAQRVVPLIKQALDENGVGGQHDRRQPLPARHRVAGADYRRRRARPARAAPRTGDRGPRRRPACTATGSEHVSVGATHLQPSAGAQPHPGDRRPTFTVKFTNQGENDETNVKVTVAVKPTAAKPITVDQDRSPRRRPERRRP